MYKFIDVNIDATTKMLIFFQRRIKNLVVIKLNGPKKSSTYELTQGDGME